MNKEYFLEKALNRLEICFYFAALMKKNTMQKKRAKNSNTLGVFLGIEQVSLETQLGIIWKFVFFPAAYDEEE